MVYGTGICGTHNGNCNLSDGHGKKGSSLGPPPLLGGRLRGHRHLGLLCTWDSVPESGQSRQVFFVLLTMLVFISAHIEIC